MSLMLLGIAFLVVLSLAAAIVATVIIIKNKKD